MPFLAYEKRGVTVIPITLDTVLSSHISKAVSLLLYRNVGLNILSFNVYFLSK
jgi:hypothetical protein